MHNQIKTLFVSEPSGLSYMFVQDQFEQIDEYHVKFDTTRNVTLKDILINTDYPFGKPTIFESLNVKLIESITATIVDVCGKLETRNVKEMILDLEFLDIDRELNTIDQYLKDLPINRLNETERFEKLVGNVSVIAR